MGDNAEHTLNQSDPPMIELMKRQQQQQHCETPPLPLTPFRKTLVDTITLHAGMPGDDTNTDVDVKIGEADGQSFTSIIEELRFIACEAKLWISGGGVHTAVPQSDLVASTMPPNERKIYNTHVIIDSDGQIKAYYHKTHLFDVSVPGVNLRESKTTAPGKKLVVCDSPVGKLALTICYDMRFSEMYVDLVQRGAEVLLMPSAFTVPTGKAHWHALLRARAIESQCYVLAAAQVGRHSEKRQSYGHSVVYDPWGKLVADAGGYDGKGLSGVIESQQDESSPVRVPSIIMSEIDLDMLASIRERMPIQQHRNNSTHSR